MLIKKIISGLELSLKLKIEFSFINMLKVLYNISEHN